MKTPVKRNKENPFPNDPRPKDWYEVSRLRTFSIDGELGYQGGDRIFLPVEYAEQFTANRVLIPVNELREREQKKDEDAPPSTQTRAVRSPGKGRPKVARRRK